MNPIDSSCWSPVIGTLRRVLMSTEKFCVAGGGKNNLEPKAGQLTMEQLVWGMNRLEARVWKAERAGGPASLISSAQRGEQSPARNGLPQLWVLATSPPGWAQSCFPVPSPVPSPHWPVLCGFTGHMVEQDLHSLLTSSLSLQGLLSVPEGSHRAVGSVRQKWVLTRPKWPAPKASARNVMSQKNEMDSHRLFKMPPDCIIRMWWSTQRNITESQKGMKYWHLLPGCTLETLH